MASIIAFTKTASFLLLTILSIRKSKVYGEMHISHGEDKDESLKVTGKRINFRLPADNSFDPNFWPSRGRRSKDFEKNCIFDENFVHDKGGLRCQDPEELKIKDLQNNELDLVEKLCYAGGRMEITEKCRKRLKGMPEASEKNWWYWFGKEGSDRPYKKQRHLDIPEVVLYENGLYWDLDNFSEKEKKDDMFWVRGILDVDAGHDFQILNSIVYLQG